MKLFLLKNDPESQFLKRLINFQQMNIEIKEYKQLKVLNKIEISCLSEFNRFPIL